MKSKKLIIVVLVLAIVTTLSAGTLAIYTTSLDNVAQTSVTAKRFVVKAGETASKSFSFRLAPTESATTDALNVVNHDGDIVSEVPIDLTVAISSASGIERFFAAMPDATIELFDNGAPAELDDNGTPAAMWTAANYKTATYKGAKFSAGSKEEHAFTMRVTWVDNADLSKAQTEQASTDTSNSFTLNVVANQHVPTEAEANNVPLI